jgi:hypothetical protein
MYRGRELRQAGREALKRGGRGLERRLAEMVRAKAVGCLKRGRGLLRPWVKVSEGRVLERRRGRGLNEERAEGYQSKEVRPRAFQGGL